MSEDLAWRMLLFAGEMFVVATLAMALAYEAAQHLKARASMRHLVMVVAFGTLLVLPVLAALVPPQIRLSLVPQSPPAVAMHEAVAATPVAADIAPAPAFAIHVHPAEIALGIVIVWFAGLSAFALRGLIAAFGLRALRRNSAPHRFANFELPQIGQRCEVRFAAEAENCGPVTWGFFRPVILLPRDAAYWPRQRLHAVLLHELAHIRRRDSLWQMLSHLVCTLYWPNPFVWIGARALRRDAEIAADDAVLAAGMKPSAYAGELLQIAAEFRDAQLSLAALSMAAPSSLRARVTSVLANNPTRSGVTTMDVFKIASLALLATGAVTFARPSLAQDAPQPPAAVVAAPEASPLPVADAAPVAQPAPVASPAAPAVSVEPSTMDTKVTAATAAEATSPNVKVRQETHMVHGHKVRRVWVTVDGKDDPAEAMARVAPEIDRAMANMHDIQPKIDEAMTKIRAAQPEIERAMISIHRVQPEIERALAQARAELAKADMDVKVKERIDDALKRAEVKIVIMKRNGHHHAMMDDDGDHDAVETPDTK